MRHLLFYIPLLLSLVFSMQVEAKKKKYPNGDYYEGKWKKGSPHGLGTMYYANGDVYVGNWVYGKYSGEGEKTYKTGKISKYTGAWDNNLQHGNGIMYFSNGNIYKGQFDMSNISGSGKMTYFNKDIYEGSWVNNSQSGVGKLTCNNGDIYEGFWENNEFINGKAVINGSEFEGSFSSGKIIKGKQKNKDGSWLEGEWVNGTFFNGTCDAKIKDMYYNGTWKNGTFYNGTCKGNINDEYYNGRFIEGNFVGEYNFKNKNNILEFKGIKTEKGCYNGTAKFKSGIYIGDLNCNVKKNGKGELYLNNDTLYISGIWNDGIIHDGKGRFTYKDSNYDINIQADNDSVVIVLYGDSEEKKSFHKQCLSNDDSLYFEIKNIIHEKELYISQLFFDKYLKERIFACSMRLDEYEPAMALIGDMSALYIHRIIACDTRDVLYFGQFVTLDEKKAQNYDRGKMIQLFAIMKKFHISIKSSYQINNSTLQFNNQTYSYDSSKNAIYDKKGRVFNIISIEDFQKLTESFN